MLRIRKEQLEILKSYMTLQFENRMIAHIQFDFSSKYKELGEKGIRSLIQRGISNAASYGIKRENDVSRFINLMIVFKEDFDTDQTYEWAQNILTNDMITNSSYKMDILYTEAERHLSSP